MPPVGGHGIEDQPHVVARRVRGEHLPTLIEADGHDRRPDPLGLLVLEEVGDGRVFDEHLRSRGDDEDGQERVCDPAKRASRWLGRRIGRR